MAIPAFLADLRSVVGSRMLWLSAVVAVVLDDDGRVLLVQRVDDGCWAPPGGILDPGEQPADGAARECLEETGVVAVPEQLLAVTVSPEITYPNGDLTQYLEVVFRCRPTGGEVRLDEDETLAVGWYALDALPPMGEKELGWIHRAVSGHPEAAFQWNGAVRP
ncbi:NUDIX domain-containing protein [Kitasatospora sp. NPDC057692]|uniref:NUDIX hydrolase n=1 Tax=Kitasatospora sp. NPDC057692 TaxID=3346215 RepID=UPI0036C421C4